MSTVAATHCSAMPCHALPSLTVPQGSWSLPAARSLTRGAGGEHHGNLVALVQWVVTSELSVGARQGLPRHDYVVAAAWARAGGVVGVRGRAAGWEGALGRGSGCSRQLGMGQTGMASDRPLTRTAARPTRRTRMHMQADCKLRELTVGRSWCCRAAPLDTPLCCGTPCRPGSAAGSNRCKGAIRSMSTLMSHSPLPRHTLSLVLFSQGVQERDDMTVGAAAQRQA